MSAEPIEQRYEEVCDRLAQSLQQIVRLEAQVFSLKSVLNTSEEFIERMLQRENSWEPSKTMEPPHHISTD